MTADDDVPCTTDCARPLTLGGAPADGSPSPWDEEMTQQLIHWAGCPPLMDSVEEAGLQHAGCSVSRGPRQRSE